MSAKLPALRAAWHAAARRNFQSWLDRGGFSQYEDQAQPMPDGDTQQVGTCS
ncbi:hypothetical protein [Massilia consociata]|uniref:Uncharacterized protein n=1 Tax=Massilia consociata TaxID=760117 RepID=A0ABV6FIQ4_9BURK